MTFNPQLFAEKIRGRLNVSEPATEPETSPIVSPLQPTDLDIGVAKTTPSIRSPKVATLAPPTKPRELFEIRTPSPEKARPVITRGPEPSFVERIFSKLPQSVQDIGQNIKEGLFGRGQEVDLAGELKFSGGLVGDIIRPFGIGKTKAEKVSDRIDLLKPLVDAGTIKPERAREIIESVLQPRGLEALKEKVPPKELVLTREEKRTLRPVIIEETLDKIFGALDLVSLGTLTPLKRVAAQKIAASKSVNKIIDILTEEIPDLVDAAKDAMARALVGVDNADDVQTVINRTQIAVQDAAKARAGAEVVSKEIKFPVRDPRTGRVRPVVRAPDELVVAKKPTEAPVRPVTEIKPTVVPKISKELEPLVEEARKFNTADEFADAFQKALRSGETVVPVRVLDSNALKSKQQLTDFFNKVKEDVRVEAKVAVKEAVTEELQSLTKTAREFKTSDEFIRSLSEEPQFFHGTRSLNVPDINIVGLKPSTDETATFGKGVYLAEKENVAKLFPEEFEGEKSVISVRSTRPLNLRTLTDQERADLVDLIGPEQEALITKLRENNKFDGFRTTDASGEVQIIIYNEDLLKTESQLTDIFNKAKGEVPEEAIAAQKVIVPLETVTKGLKATAPEIPPKKDLKKNADGIAMEGRKDVLKEPLAKLSEEESLDVTARTERRSEFAEDTSIKKQEEFDNSLDSIFAEMKGVRIEDLKTSFTAEELFQAQFHYKTATEQILDNPARKLSKFANKKTGELPEVTGEGTSIFARTGDDIVTELGFKDSEEARAAYNIYLEQKKRLSEIQDNFREISTEIRLQKQRNQFVESSKRVLSREVAANARALKNIVDAATLSGFKKGLTIGNDKLKSMVSRLKNRRAKINAVKKVFNLTDAEMKKVRGDRDPRFMDQDVFDEYLAEIEQKAIMENKKAEERTIIEGVILEKELQKTENLRTALNLPPMKKMTLDELFEFDAALSQAQFQDTFLGSRMIQTIINTDIGAVKTVREIRESLAKQTGTDIRELEGVVGDWGDKFNYDPALAEKNPLYKYMVTEWTAKKIQTEQHVLAIKQKIDDLAFASRKSRKRTIKERLVPQDKLVIEWLESPDKDFVEKAMSPEQIEFAKYLNDIYRHYYEFAKNEAVTRKTLYGIKHSRFEGVYFPHTPITFLERWSDDGFVLAIKNYWENLVEQRVDFSAIGATGEVLGYEKFLKFAIKREGEAGFTKNAARSTLNYVGAFEKKLALDAMIPKVDAYTFSLTRKTGIKDPTGIDVDGKLREFVRQWLNNKKGRKVTLVVDQGSKMDARLRALKLFISIKDLGFNIITGTASLGGNVIANFTGLTSKEYAKGVKRGLSTKGVNIGKKYNGVIGEPTFENIISSANDIGDTFLAGAFSILQDVAYRSKRQFLLGSLTDEEWKTGEVSLKRLVEIKGNMGRFHPMDDTKSVVGSTSEAQVVTLYKSWAVPFLMTAKVNAGKMTKAFKEAEGLSGKAKALKTREAKELAKLTVGAASIYLFFHSIFEDDDANDRTFVAQMKRRFVRETSSSLSALNPNTWLSIRLQDFLIDVVDGILMLARMEEYETSGTDFDKGDLKGLTKLKREFTPSAVRQFLKQQARGKKQKKNGVEGLEGLKSLEALKGLKTLKSLKGLESLKALENL